MVELFKPWLKEIHEKDVNSVARSTKKIAESLIKKTTTTTTIQTKSIIIPDAVPSP